MAQTTNTIMTAEELLDRRIELGVCELIRGELIPMSPAGAYHGSITMKIAMRIAQYAEAHNLGQVYSAETGFILERNPDTVREADVPFVRADRVPAKPAPGFFDGAPDFVIEVLSPGDRASEVAEKIEQWLDAGCCLVWIVDRQRRTATVYRDPGHAAVLHADDVLTGDDVLPGFELKVADIFG